MLEKLENKTCRIDVRGIPEKDLILFDYYCKELNLKRSEMIKYLIKNIGQLPSVLDAEIRYQKFAKDIQYSLDLNTKALIKAIEYGIVQSPLAEQNEQDIINAEENEENKGGIING